MSAVPPLSADARDEKAVPTLRTPELTAAFAAFNESSLQLQSSYAQLERRVSVMTRELAQARTDRLAELAEKERLANRLSTLLATLPGAVVVLDSDDRIYDFNDGAVALFGCDLHGRPWHLTLAAIEAQATHGGSELLLPDGRHLSMSVRPLEGDDGRVVLLTDVTQTREAQDAAQREERLCSMGEMMARLAHQARTPLASAMLYAAQAQRRPDEVDTAAIGNRISSKLREMEQMFADMLCFARGCKGGGTLVSVRQLLTNAIDSVPEGTARMISLQPVAADLFLRGNPKAIVGAVANLLQNAAVFSRNANIELSAERRADGHIVVRVTDDGPGIAASLAGRIFEPFFTTRSTGTGLGLAVVRSVAQGHGGHAWLERSDDTGSTFAITLPDARRLGHAPVAPSATPDPPSPASTPQD